MLQLSQCTAHSTHYSNYFNPKALVLTLTQSSAHSFTHDPQLAQLTLTIARIHVASLASHVLADLLTEERNLQDSTVSSTNCQI